MITKRLFLPSLFIAMIVAANLFSCSGKQENKARLDARSLYESDAAMLTSYIDSISSAPDSTTLLRLCREFEKKITDLNYNYSPAADRAISEAENDTLIMLVDRYVAIRDSLLYSFAHPNLPTDSLAADPVSPTLNP